LNNTIDGVHYRSYIVDVSKITEVYSGTEEDSTVILWTLSTFIQNIFLPVEYLAI